MRGRVFGAVALTAIGVAGCGDRATGPHGYSAVGKQTISWVDADSYRRIWIRTFAGPLVNGDGKPMPNTWFQSKCFTETVERFPYLNPYVCMAILRVNDKVYVADGLLRPVGIPPWEPGSQPLPGTLRRPDSTITMTGVSPAGAKAGTFLVHISLSGR